MCWNLRQEELAAIMAKDMLKKNNVATSLGLYLFREFLKILDQHRQSAKSMRSLADQLMQRSKYFPFSSVWILDHMASKKIPKYKKETLDSWSKDKLTVHITGSYC